MLLPFLLGLKVAPDVSWCLVLMLLCLYVVENFLCQFELKRIVNDALVNDTCCGGHGNVLAVLKLISNLQAIDTSFPMTKCGIFIPTAECSVLSS